MSPCHATDAACGIDPQSDARTLARVRTLFRGVRRRGRPAAAFACATVEESVAGRSGIIALRRYLPEGIAPGPQPVILFFHGGLWIAGGLDSHDRLCRRIARATNMALIAVDYRLAPEHPYPAAVEDAMDAHAMILQRATAWNIDTSRIAVMGDGTGGTLAAVVALHARDMCLPVPVAQILFYPATDMVAADPSHIDALPLTRSLMRWARDRYIPAAADITDWRLSPLRAFSHVGLPPSLIVVAGQDMLHDQGVAFADRLAAAGVAVDLHRLPDKIHGFLTLGRTTDDGDAVIASAADFLKSRVTV